MDGNTVTLTLTTAQAQQASIDVTVKNVKDAEGVAIAETTKSVKFFDAIVPTVSSVEVTGPKTLKITFSEPITSTAITTTANFVIDNNTYSVASVAASGTNAVIVTLGTSLPAGEHTITVNNTATNANPEIKDHAGFFVPKTTQTFNYAVDNAAPVASVESAKQNEVKIKFNKVIDAATQANIRVYHTYNAQTAYQGTATWGSDNQTVTVAFTTNNNYLPIGTATIYVSNASSTSQVKDAWGNIFVDASFTAEISSDTVAPSVTTVEAKSATSIEVTFNEAVTGATTASNFTLKDSAGTAVTVSSSVLKAGTTATYTLTTAQMNGGSYTLTIANIKDTSVSANAMATATFNVSVNDLIQPTVTATGVMSTDKKKIVVKFSEAMATSGEGSIVDLANYQVQYDGGAWKDLNTITGTTISAGSGNKSAIITFTAAQTVTLGGANDNVRVGRVADTAGNKTASFTTDVAISADDVVLANVITTSEKATTKTTVVFDVDTTLSGIDVSKFTLNAGAKAATSATYVNGDNKATVTVSVSDANKFATDLSAGLVDIRIAAGGLTTSLGTSNSALITIPVANLDDYVAPGVSSTVTGDADTDGHIDTITVTYDEALYVASVTDTDYTVEGYEITGVSVAGAVVTITVKELASFDTGSTPKVTLVGAVSDNSAQRNSLGSQDAVTSTDGAAPVLVSAVITTDVTTNGAGFGNDAGDVLKLTFSEAVNTNFTVATAPTATEIDAIYVFSAGPLAGGALVLSANDLSTTASNELVLTVGTAGATNVITTAATVDAAAAPTANDIEDVANLTVVNAAAQATVNVD